jgi:enoyl-CoA hydratase/carnithine racemase
MADEVLYEVEAQAGVAGIARITINRPERRNAMSFEVMQGLRTSVARARADDSVRVVVLTGAGDKAFCAGADLVGASGDGAIASSGADAHEGRGLLADLFRDFWSLGKPVIARVRGYALAGGFGLACACDMIIASDDSQFGSPVITIGVWP